MSIAPLTAAPSPGQDEPSGPGANQANVAIRDEVRTGGSPSGSALESSSGDAGPALSAAGTQAIREVQATADRRVPDPETLQPAPSPDSGTAVAPDKGPVETNANPAFPTTTQTEESSGSPTQVLTADVPATDDSFNGKQDATAAPVTHADGAANDGMEHFQRLRRRLLVATLVATAVVTPLSWLLFDRSTALSLLVGALSGLLYLLLLARSVARLGGDRRSVGKVQLLVPVVLVLASARLPHLELVPALVGFLLYKPALLVQALLDR